MKFKQVNIFFFLILICLGCDTNPVAPKPVAPEAASDNPPYIAGIWADEQMQLSLCNSVATIGFVLELEQEQGNATIGGNSALVFSDGTLTGNVTAVVNNGGKITGQATFSDSTGDLVLNMNLSVQEMKITGTLVDPLPYKCSSGSKGTAIFNANLTFIGMPVVEDALEPNNSFEQASPIDSNFSNGELTLLEGDRDWFSFELKEESMVSIKILGEGIGDTHHIEVVFVNEQQGRIFEFNFNGQEDALREFYLDTGKYAMLVSESSLREVSNYQLELKAVSVPDSEFEPNNERSQASNIDLDFSESLFLNAGDIDWFTFALTEDSILNIDLRGSEETVFFELFNKQGASIYSHHDYFNTKTKDLIMPKGSYYIRLSWDFHYGNNIDYSLSLRSTPIPDADTEPDNSFNTATPIQLPFNDSMAMFKNDEDWLKFSINGSQRLLEIGITDIFDVLQTELYSDQGELLGQAGSKRTVFIVEEGDYFFKFSSDYFSDYLGYTYGATITDEEIPDLEYEPNNTMQEAKQIDLTFNDPDLLVSQQDNDWYQLDLVTATQVTFSLKRLTLGAVILQIYDENQKFLHGFGDTNTSSPILPQGKIFIRVYSDKPLRYGLSLEATQ